MQLLRPVPHAVSQAFGAYPTRGNPHPTFGDYQPFGHLGIDYACPAGTPVRAAHDGVLDWLGWSHHMSAAMQSKWMMGGSDASGVCVHLDAGNGLGTTYNHLLSASVPDIHVKAGQIIGYSGATGRSAGDHVHFELVRIPAPNDGIRYGRIDPAPYIVNSLPSVPTTGGTGAPSTKPAQEDTLSAAEVKKIIDAIEAEGKATRRYVGQVLVFGYTVGGKAFPGIAAVNIETQKRVTQLPRKILRDTKVKRGGKEVSVIQEIADAKTFAAAGLTDIDLERIGEQFLDVLEGSEIILPLEEELTTAPANTTDLEEQ